MIVPEDFQDFRNTKIKGEKTMEMNKWVLGTVAFAGGLLVGKNWKKIAEFSKNSYNKSVKAIKKDVVQPIEARFAGKAKTKAKKAKG